jgi:nucleoside-diphosphate-sugar epimerase
MNHNKTVSVLGCGWLGLPLGEHLLSLGFKVKGSTTRESKLETLRTRGIEAYKINLIPELEADDIERFLDADTLFINIPPAARKYGTEHHPAQISNLLPYVQKSAVNNIIYVSSTSVYPNLNREMYEDEPLVSQNGSVDGVASVEVNHTLLKVENMIRDIPAKNITILRPGGLIGGDRIPGKYVAGKQGLTTGGVPVNYIHPVDLVRIIGQVIEQDVWGKTFNVVAPEHPSRRQVYEKNAQMFGYEPAQYAEDNADFKIINGDRIVNRISYSFVYPDPLTFHFSP